MELYSILFSSKGSSRSINEDNFCYDSRISHSQNDIFLQKSSDTIAHYAVFDGMGGLSQGLTASRISAETFLELFNSNELFNASVLSEQYYRTNKKLCDLIASNNYTRLGTTAVTLSIIDEKVFYSNIGDSKLFRIRNHNISQLTKDHSEVQFLLDQGFITYEQSKLHPSRNRLTQHLGIFVDEFQIDPYIGFDIAEEGDIYVLATDGVTHYFESESLLELFEANNLLEASNKLIKTINEEGASDNFTFIVVMIEKGAQ